jgi:HD-GYP domain-containing protein (c-di-GMP phosphodiesterase class II)
VCRLASRVGRELRLDVEALRLLDGSVRMRDVGMIGLPDGVVLAIKPLSPSDWELVNQHPVLGQELLEPFEELILVAPIVRAHHERWDGGGYPDGLNGDDIPLLSRIIATCDAFVAIASDRPHRRGLGAEAALEVLVTESGAQFDPATVRALTASLTTGTAPSQAAVPQTAARPRSRPTGGSSRRARRNGRSVASSLPPPKAISD